MSSAECLLKLLGSLSLEGCVEYSSSIIYHSSQLLRKSGDWMEYALGNQSPSFQNFLPPKKMRTVKIQCLCCKSRCVDSRILSFALNMELVDFIKSDLVVVESIVYEVDVELECGGQ